MRIKEYEALWQEHSAANASLKRRYNLISNLRGLVAVLFLVCLWFLIREGPGLLWVPLLVLVAAFVVLMRIHDRIAWRMEFQRTLVKINEDEVAHLRDRKRPYPDGSEFIDHTHAYSFDLDIFGPSSLYQHLNRTATFGGGVALARTLKQRLADREIPVVQEAVKEIAGRVGFRQEVYALARMAKDSREDHQGLIAWAGRQKEKLSWLVDGLSYIGPAALIACLLMYSVGNDPAYLNAAGMIFLFNLLVFVRQVKRIKAEMTQGDAMHRTIKAYARVLERIEQEEFSSAHLKQLHHQLLGSAQPVSAHVRRLSQLLANMDSMHSGIGAILFNGTLLFHVHNLRALLKWRSEHAGHIPVWLEVMAGMESLASLGNFAHNEPVIAWPELNFEYKVIFKDAGHPLIDPAVRVTNDIAFDAHRFVILSGSNMSGKSTFLRTLGVNMVLAGAGAPVCASHANIHPLDVLVSMRSSDSLDEGESYFFAEVKRLSGIMKRLDHEVCFVLLDEILRGTNSDDKRNGTIEVIRKLVAKKAVGMIATHDLEVCATTEEFPGLLANKCFEVQVVNDALHFDHLLRDGVSQNRSATFLMKKMGVI
jgi:hypothetical protein